jgi:sec-independent protein translocase protein TatA
VIGDIFQPTHLLFILVVALLVLGPKRLPEVGRALGKGLRDFRSALSDVDPRQELHEHSAESVQPPPPPPAPSPPSEPAEHSG